MTPQQVIDEWTLAENAWMRLQGQCLVAIAPGNHDQHGDLSYSEFRTYFDWTEPAAGQGGHYSPDPEPIDSHYGGIHNAYWRKTIAGVPFLFLTLECNTSTGQYGTTESDLIRWAKDDVVRQYPNDIVVLITHDYYIPLPLSIEGHRKYLWHQLVSQCPNVVMVFSGHAGPTLRTQDTNAAERIVNELQFDYQQWDGFLYPQDLSLFSSPFRTSAIARLMTIDPLSGRVQVKQWGCEMGGWLRNLPDEPMDADEFPLVMDQRQ
jgi:hypothetical protein